MKTTALVKIASLSALFVGALSLPALAGSSYVENDFSIRNIYNGRSKTDVKVNTRYDFDRTATSTASKVGTSHTTTTQMTKGDIDGLWQEQSFREVDDFDISTSSTSTETGWGHKTEEIRVTDTYSYNGIDKTHRVTSGYDF